MRPMHGTQDVLSLEDSRPMTNAQKQQTSSTKKNIGRDSIGLRFPERSAPPKHWSRRSKQRFRSILGRLRRSATLAVVGASLLVNAPHSYAQLGAAPMGQAQGLSNGVVNRGVAQLGAINNSGPGFLYYGVNGAGRGLGYIGSYMTLGGFIPYAQDDLGGFWHADLRGPFVDQRWILFERRHCAKAADRQRLLTRGWCLLGL